MIEPCDVRTAYETFESLPHQRQDGCRRQTEQNYSGLALAAPWIDAFLFLGEIKEVADPAPLLADKVPKLRTVEMYNPGFNLCDRYRTFLQYAVV